MIRILTDSTADILPHEAARLNLELVPLQVSFENGETCRDGLDLTPTNFTQGLVQCGKLPTTSQPSPGAVLSTSSRAAGDEIIAILLSSQISGTYQSAQIAAETCGYGKIYLVDSQNATLGEQLLVRLALRLRAEGAPAGQIVETLEREKHKIRLIAVVDDLKYFRKGGRLSGAGGLAGSLLGIKPVVSVQGGKVGACGQGPGMPAPTWRCSS